MKKSIVAAAALLTLVSWTVGAQEKAKPEDPKAKSGHQAMPKSGGGSTDAATIARAMSAAPPTISKNAGVMAMTADGKMKEVRASTNGWMCIVEPNGTPMCLDKEWQAPMRQKHRRTISGW